MKTDINALREHLFETIEALKAKDMDVERARAISEVAGRIIDSAKVEVQFLDVTGQKKGSRFLEPPPPVPVAGPGLRAIASGAQGGGDD